MSIDTVNSFLSMMAILGQIFIAALIIRLLFFRKHNNTWMNFVADKAIPLAFIVALVATGGSLYYSEIANFKPCDLCWFQRIFMYPQVVLLGLAWLKKEDSVVDYSLTMVCIGFCISTYHNFIYYTSQTSSFCSIAVPCTQKYVVGFNYISIPLLALTAFTMIGLLLLNKKY
jgi:disulfide bond formation protein DsbB